MYHFRKLIMYEQASQLVLFTLKPPEMSMVEGHDARSSLCMCCRMNLDAHDLQRNTRTKASTAGALGRELYAPLH